MASSMRYVRGSGGNVQENEDNTRARDISRITSAGGRSSRARGRGWGRGRGGGAHLGRGRGGGRGGGFSGRGRFSRSFVRGASDEMPNNSPFQKLAPELSGNRWVRGSGKNNDKAESTEDVKCAADESPETETTVPMADVISSNISKTADTNPNYPLERQGKHKLIMKRDSSEIASDNIVELSSNGDKEHEVSGNREPIDESSVKAKAVLKGKNTWKRQSSKSSGEPNRKNNLINNSTKNQSSVPRRVCSELDQTETERTSNNDMERRGFGKLVLKVGDSKQTNPEDAMVKVALSGNKSQSWNRQEFSRSPKDDSTKGDKNNTTEKFTGKKNSKQNTWQVGFHGKRKRAGHSTGPRRICIVSKPSMSSNDTPKDSSEGDQINAPDGQNAVETNEASSSSDPKPPSTEKTLTDFCYQNTGGGRSSGRGRGRGRSRGRGRGHPAVRGGRGTAGKSMGLVRVKPQNPSSTPICPTFRRGLPCSNPKCTLRHDVSTEASRPLCVFFQRNGMCSKGDDCPFRHIKVRWDAEICPMFEKLGYCEDPDCTLRHVVAKKSRVKSSAK